jgi:hypothetical protein
MSAARDAAAPKKEVSAPVEAAPGPALDAPLPKGRVPQALSPSAVLTLQRTAGNASVARYLANCAALARQDAGVADPVAGVRDPGAPAAAPDAGGQMTLDPVAGTVTAAPPRVDAVAPESQTQTDDFRAEDVLLPAALEAEDAARLRELYQKGAKAIADEARAMEQAAGGDPAKLREVADWAVKSRNALKAKIRDQGARILKAIAEARNIRKYGNPLGPSAEALRGRGITDQQIIESATRSNKSVTRWVGRLRIAGRIMIAIDIGIAMWRISEAETNRPHVIGEEVGGILGVLAGAAAGGWAGAKVGAVIGGLAGAPAAGVGAAPGAGIGALIGGIGGAIAGGWAGRKAGGWVADQIYPPDQTEFEGDFVE